MAGRGDRWGFFEWFCVATTALILGGILVYFIWLDAGY
jgi:hypothetical protein